MKKLLLLLLLISSASYSQAEFSEGINLSGNTATAETSKIVSQQPGTGMLNYVNAISLPLSTATIAELDNIKSQINPNTYIVTDNGYSQSGQNVTINASWVWKINNINYTNPLAIVRNIPLASAGFTRIDLIVLNEFNDAVRVAGTAVTGTPVSPAVPLNTIQIMFITTNSVSSTPVLPKPIYPVSQLLRNGELRYAPSEDVVFDALNLVAPKNYKTYFINSSTGNNATGVYEDASKPFATIDYVNANFTLVNGDTFYLQGTGLNYPINGIFQNKSITIKADATSTNTLNFSANNNSNLIPYTTSPQIIIDIPNGFLYNDRSGGTGCYLADTVNGFGEIKINVKEIYWNTSTTFFTPQNFDIKVKKVSLSRFFVGLFASFGGGEIEISEIVCLANNVQFFDVGSFQKNTILNVALISGSGSYKFRSLEFNVGDITTTGVCSISGNVNKIIVNFVNSTITTAGGFNISPTSLGQVIITGNIISTTSLFISPFSSGFMTIYFKNFYCNLVTGQLVLAGETLIIENSIIKSTNSPINLGNNSGGNVILKNSSFEVVNSVPLMNSTGTTVATMKIEGVSHNATSLSNQEGAGVTVTITGKMPVANGVAPKDAVNLSQVQNQLKDFFTDLNNVSTTETDLYSYTTVANRLNATGEKIVASYGGTLNDVTASSQLKAYFGGTLIADTGALTMSVVGAWIINVSIIRTSTTTARAIVNISTPGASTASYTKYTSVTGLTFTNTNIIKITGQAGGATGGNDDITATFGNVQWQPAGL